MQTPLQVPLPQLAPPNTPPRGLHVISGPRGAGKSTWCAALIAEARRAPVTIAGVHSRAIFENGKKTGILLEDIRTGERRVLGRLANPADGALRVGCWNFDPQVLAWGNAALQHIGMSDLIVVDELGPLEFSAGGGLTAGMQLLDQGRYRSAWVVIRPELVDAACARWPVTRVYYIPGAVL